MKATLRLVYLCRTANMSWRTCVVVKQIQSNQKNPGYNQATATSASINALCQTIPWNSTSHETNVIGNVRTPTPVIASDGELFLSLRQRPPPEHSRQVSRTAASNTNRSWYTLVSGGVTGRFEPSNANDSAVKVLKWKSNFASHSICSDIIYSCLD